MNEYNFNVKFEKGRISSNLKKLVQNDYNLTKINFTFDKEGRKLFKMLYPDETAYITQIDNDELIFGPGVLNQDGIYEVEIALYTENGRLTDYATTKFDVRAELIQSDEIVELDDRLPILDSLINDVQGVKTGVEDAIQYATEQGDYAKEQANRNFDAIEEATKIVDNFEENVNEYKEDFDNNATTKLNEYNANADDLMTIAVDTRNELERIKNDVLETGEASDIFVHLTDSTMAEYQELEVEGVCEQVITTGKNIANTKIGKWDYLGVTIEYDEETQILTINGTATGDATFPFEQYNFKEIPIENEKLNLFVKYISGNCISNNNPRILLSDTLWTNSMTLPLKDINNDVLITKTIGAFLIYSILRFSYFTGDIFNNLKIKLMICKGNDTSYEPYTGGKASPSPDYPQEISVIENELKVVSCNKNLFDGKLELGNFNSTTGEKIPNTSYIINSNYIKVNELENYKFSLNGNSLKVYVFEYKEDYSFNLTSRKTINENDYLTTNKDTRYINFRTMDEITDTTSKIQIEIGTQATSYEEHLETVINANLGNEFVGKINDTSKDTLRVSYNEEDGEYHLYLDKMLSKVVLNGSETIYLLETLTNVCRFSIENIINSKAGTRCLSNKFICYENQKINSTFNGADMEAIHIRDDKKGIGIKINKTTASTVEGFKNWLSNNNMQVVYEVENPYTLDLGIVDMPITYDEVTNLFTDSDLLPTINAKYYRNFKETINNLQNNVDTINETCIKKDNYATSQNAGVVKTSNGLYLENGSTTFSSVSYEDYLKKSNTYVISKGTLENILKAYGLSVPVTVEEVIE